jgi:hypothetical protein
MDFKTARGWDNHVSRMMKDRIVRVVRDNIPKGRISPGRPKNAGPTPLLLFFKKEAISLTERKKFVNII